MTRNINFADKMAKRLPGELFNFIKQAGEIASRKGGLIYLVGGAVRDLLLDTKNFDIDLVVEGDAIALADDLKYANSVTIKVHRQFNTAKINWQHWSIDLATARQESYERPGALPTVKPGSIKDDLFRRDFTINAMAIGLSPTIYGNLIDPYNGQGDLGNRLIRVLHEKSFIDDSTRIWRGLRYEQRLDFRLEENTLILLKRDMPMLESISGDRIRYELECILQEELPERVLRRVWEMGALGKINPSLKGNSWLSHKFRDARQMNLPDQTTRGIYMALLTYNLADKEIEQFISYLRLPKQTAQILRDSASIRGIIEKLADARVKPSSIYNLLHGNSPLAITTSIIAYDSVVSRQNMQLYVDKLRYVKTLLDGNDLQEMGITPGPRIKEILNRLLDARLDGEVETREDEEELASKQIND